MKKFIKILLSLVCIFTLNINVFAEDDIQTNCIGGPDGTNCGGEPLVIAPAPDNKPNGQEFYADENVTVKGDHDFTTFAAGNSVNVDADIDGVSFIAGKTISAKGSADYSFIGGYELNLNEYYIKDGFFAGYSVNLKDATGRTLYIAANKIEITDSDFTKLYLSGDKIVLKGNFEDVVVAGSEVIVDGSITGTLRVNENAKLDVKDDAYVTETVKYKESEKEEEFSGTNAIIGTFMHSVRSFCVKFLNLLLVGFVLIYCGSKAFNKLSKIKQDSSYVFGKIGLGLCLLVVIPIAAIVLLLTGIGASLGAIAILAYVGAIIISTPVATIHYGNILLPKIKNDYLRYLVSLLIVELAKLLPIVGGLVTFLVLCLGLGLIKDILVKEKKEK